MRASFEIRIWGYSTEVNAAFEQLHELLVERGFFPDEDFELIHNRVRVAMRFHTVSALQAATALLPSVNVFSVVTNAELNY